MDRASAAETVGSGSILGRVKLKTIKMVFTASLLDLQQLTSTACGRQVAAWLAQFAFSWPIQVGK